MNRLYPCPRCVRHIRVLERICPFCRVALDSEPPPPRRLPSERLSRAAQIAFMLTLGAAAGCAPRDGQRAAAPVRNAPRHQTDTASPPPKLAPADAGAAHSEVPHNLHVVPIYGGGPVELLEPVFFAQGSAEIGEDLAPTLAVIAELLEKVPSRVQITGFADRTERNTGSLAKKRVLAVRAALVRLGIPEGRFVVASGGADHPIEPAGTTRGIVSNRRVEFKILEEDRGP